MPDTPNTSPITHQARFLTVEDDYEGQRLDNFLQRELKGLPKTRIYRLMRTGEIRVNKGRVKPDYRVATGDMIRIPPMRLSAETQQKSAGPGLVSELKSRVLYEDDKIMVVDKPSGLAAHGGSGLDFGLIEAMRSISAPHAKLELVHRLDRETSGCIMLASKRSALRELHRQFREREVDKHYIALVQGQWPAALQRVDAPLLKTTSEAGERMVKVHRDGQTAATNFRVLQRFSDATLVQASPVTGRTHQIRVHALHAGHPLFGDDRYGERGANKACRAQGLKRLFLHASRLSFTNMAGERITVEAELDRSLQLFLDRLS